MFARVEPGAEYRVVSGEGDDLAASEPFDVPAADDPPDSELYESQELEEGFQYIEMRDGTLLSVMVRFPGEPIGDTPSDGPYPTVIEMSGYSPSNPDAMEASTLGADSLGYATVGVNLRGTTCSGGNLSFFEPAQVADMYDVIETVASQDWVANSQVGMVGLSYPGITQLFAARNQPPSLAAIAPLSVIDDTYRSTLYPGGIFNNGFAQEWAQAVTDRAEPAGDEWVAQRIDEGDETCEANQALRSQNPQLVDTARAYPFRDPDAYDLLSPDAFADRIEVPVFLAGAFQDEQTGGHFPAMIERFGDNPQARFTLVNGTHAEALLTADIFQRWTEFLDFYVARRIPEMSPLVRAGGPDLIAGAVGLPPVAFPPDRFTEAGSYDEALDEYEAEPRVRVLFESGGADPVGGAAPRFEEGFESWPPPDAEPTAWHFQPDGDLAVDEPTVEDGAEGAADQFRYDPAAGQETTFDGGTSEAFSADFTWAPPPEGELVSYLTDPLEEDLTVVGPGRVDLFLASTAEDTDVEVTISEVRPDGTEVYVQSGWLRASHRALDEERSTELQPVHTHLEEDAEPLEPGEYTEVAVELFPSAHVFREGSQLRLTVDSPGGTRPFWRFDSTEGADVINRIAHSEGRSSRVTLPVVSGVDVPDGQPACPGLRGQPCTDYEPVENQPAEE